MRQVPQRTAMKGKNMAATATVTKSGVKPKAKNADVPAGFRLIRGRLIPVGKRRPIADRIQAAEDKLAKFDAQCVEKRQAIVENLEAIKNRHSKAATFMELTKDKSAAEAMTDVEAKLTELLAARRALKSGDATLRRPKAKAKA